MTIKTAIMTLEDKNEAIELLHEGGWSCVVCNGTEVRTFSRRGVADLLHLLRNEPLLLDGAFVADKVVGKGAAALMALGGVDAVWADVISVPARKLLENNNIQVTCSVETDGIRNREGNGPCPVEALCADCATAADCLPLIENFVAEMMAANPKN